MSMIGQRIWGSWGLLNDVGPFSLAEEAVELSSVACCIPTVVQQRERFVRARGFCALLRSLLPTALFRCLLLDFSVCVMHGGDQEIPASIQMPPGSDKKHPEASKNKPRKCPIF